MPRVRLRGRVALTFAALGLIVSTCVAMVAVHFSDSYVNRLVDEMLRVEADHLRERFTIENRIPRLHTRHFYVFTDAPGSADPPPPEIAALGLGVHELNDASRGERHVGVYELRGQHLYIVLDIGLESVRERRLARDLVALVLFGTGLSAWLGWLWAGRAIDPVRRLANRVETLEPTSHGTTVLAPDFADDEVGALARAFDRYQERLYVFVRRERAFTADASHEMRTPLAVIRGALEVMLDRLGHDPANVARIKRMQRGSDELSDLLDALLILARGDELDSSTTNNADLSVVVNQLLRDRSDAFAQKKLSLDCRIPDSILLPVPQRVLDVVTRNLLRAATEFAEDGTVSIEVTATCLRIGFRRTTQGQATAPVQASGGDERADRILGMGMIRRVCERRHWRLDESTDSAGSRSFALHFSKH